MARTVIIAAVFALSLCLTVSAMPSWYQCNTSNCPPPKCMCASNSAPGGLSPADTPQFILLTHDDAVEPLAEKLMNSVSAPHQNPNGCNVPVTFYVLQQNTDCTTVKRLWQQNHEMALHTVDHVSLYTNYKGNMTQEMMGVRTFLNQTCGIPLTDLVGFRDPYLVHNAATRTVQENNGVLYDSSMIEAFQADSQVETKPGERVWPFTMDFGIPINCNWNYPDGQCNQTTERYPGLWEVPLWELQGPNGEHLYSMDVGVNPPGDIYQILTDNFNMNYNGNRAPLGIYLHSTWFDTAGNNAAALNKFMSWAMAQPNVWAITTKDLIRWMQAPVPASQMSNWLKCNPVDLSNPTGTAKCQLYTVQAGDSAYSVATKFAVVVPDILALNPNLGNGDSLSVGQQIKIPVWDSSCTGDNIKNVTGPNQVPVTPSPTTPSSLSSSAVTSDVPFNYGNPSSGIHMNMTLAGRPVLAFQTDLKTPFSQEVAHALGVTLEAVQVVDVTPLNTVAGRRLMQSALEAPIVSVDIIVGSPNPQGLLKNATTVFPQGGTFDTQVLPNYNLKMTAPPQVSIFDYAASNNKDSSGTSNSVVPSSSSGHSGLSTGAIVGIAVGGAVVILALIAVVVVFVVRRRRANNNAKSHSPMSVSSSTAGKFANEKIYDSDENQLHP